MQLTNPHRRAVILGASGFIGINLAHALTRNGCEVTCFDRMQHPHWPQQAKIITGDYVSTPHELLDTINDATVYHLISSCRPSPNTLNAADEVVADVATTLRYLEQTRNRNVRWIFVSSGGTIYGPSVQSPTTEDAQTNPVCSYGLVKLSLEKYFGLYKKLHGTDYVVARVSNPYGPWQNPLSGQGVIAALIHKALSRQTVEIWGDGGNIRDYLYIEDVAHGLVMLANFGESGEAYNLSSGSGTTINELIEIINRTLGVRLSTNYTAPRISDVRESILASNKLQRQTNWVQKITLEEGIKATAHWISEKLIKKT